MLKIDKPQEFFMALIEKAKNMTSSGHQMLDARWESEGIDKRNSHYRRPYYRFCQELVKTTKPGLVVELGIDEGDCSGHFASGNSKTTVLGVDVHKDNEYPSQRCRMMETQFPNFKYLRGWTWDRLEDVKKFPPIDILYIDSWHSYDYFSKDWNDYAPLLNNYSIVLVDDLYSSDDELGGPLKAWNQIQAEWKYIDHTMNPAVPFGIMINPNKNFKLKYTKQSYMPQGPK